MARACRLSAIEKVKAGSCALRGTIAEELQSSRPGFSVSNAHLLKFHGVIQHDDRDVRLKRRQEGLDKPYEFTVRVRPTGGKVTARQMLGLMALVDGLGQGSLRITSRQGIQFNQVSKSRLREVVRAVADLGLTTFSSGGDVNCNVMCCPAPLRHDGAHQQLHLLADEIATSLMPHAGVYNELWFSDGLPQQRDEQAEATSVDPTTVDPLYGKTYLPHKFKIGLALPEDNCVDVYAQDFGLLANREAGRIVGYDVLVGGGMSMIPSVAGSLPALAQPLAYVSAEEVIPLARAVLELYRDFGYRDSRSKARLKYLIRTWGLPEFRRRVEQRLQRSLSPPRGINVSGREDHLGWRDQGNGQWALGIQVESGQLEDGNRGRLASALREVLSRQSISVRLTPQQNILLCDVDASSRTEVDAILSHYEVRSADSLSGVRRGAMSCSALPYCRNAITEAERIVPQILAALESELEKLGLAGERLAICVTGCPSGCARCYLADIALVGRTVDGKNAVDKFAIFVGGDRLGRRLNHLYNDLVPIQDVVACVRPLLIQYKNNRRNGEGLGAFLAREIPFVAQK